MPFNDSVPPKPVTSSGFAFSIREFCELEPDEYLEFWTLNKLPHPGCPISFKLLLEAVIYFNMPAEWSIEAPAKCFTGLAEGEKILNQTLGIDRPTMQLRHPTITRKEQAFKELAGVVRCWPGQITAEQWASEESGLRYGHFRPGHRFLHVIWPLKAKTLIVPLDPITTPYEWLTEPLIRELNSRMAGQSPVHE